MAQNDDEILDGAVWGTDVQEMYPSTVLNFSSQYGSSRSRSYIVANIRSIPQVFPLYGDSTNALVFRTYGPWWINLPSYQAMNRNKYGRKEEEFTSRDFIEIEYNDSRQGALSLNIYETYNPGTLEVVYAGELIADGTIKWHRIWKFPEPFSILLSNSEEIPIEGGRQRIYDLFPDDPRAIASKICSMNLSSDEEQVSKIYTRHTYPAAAHLPRITKIPLSGKLSFQVRRIRLEFDHSTVDYYVELDTVGLCSRRPSPPSTPEEVTAEQRTTAKTVVESETTNSDVNLTNIPNELLMNICWCLDLRSLIRLSSTCRHLRNVCLDSLQFLSVNLQPYWNDITDDSLNNFFQYRCTQTRYLSLAWSRHISGPAFHNLLHSCSTHLLHLNLSCCQYLTRDHLESIVMHCPNVQILNLESCTSLSNLDFLPLTNLQQLRGLNVYRTMINYRTLLPLINNNHQHLEHLNLGNCHDLIDTVGIVRLIFARCSNLRSLDLWRAYHLTQAGFRSIMQETVDHYEEEVRFSSLSADEREELTRVYSIVDLPVEISSLTHMKHLSEIDLGWTDPPPGFIRKLVQQAGQFMIKIFLTACRHIANEDTLAISEHCPQLRQLDVLGSSVIIEDSIERILENCKAMEFIDLSFCSKISNEKISIWKCRYRCALKRSYSPMHNDDPHAEFP